MKWLEFNLKSNGATMPEKKLADALNDLHTDLSDAHKVDSETREQLKTLMQDIQRILDKPEDTDQATVEPVINDLNSMLLKLETDHPYTAGLLNRLAQSLANLGI
jgi:molecular chaperone DnaK (HSP70)